MQRSLRPLTNVLRRRSEGSGAAAPVDDRRRRRTVVAVGGALALHVAVLLMVLAWKAPAVLPGLSVQPVSLVSGPGPAFVPLTIATPSPPAALAPPTPAPPAASAAPAEPPPADAVAGPAAVTPSIDPAGATLAKATPIVPPKDVLALVVDVLRGGPPPASTAAAPPPPAPAAAPAVPPMAPLMGAPMAASTAVGGGKTCQIFEALQSVLQTSPAVRDALPRIPPQARSVANAVMLWDGRWQDEAGLGGPAAVEPVEQAVLATIAAASPACQAELVRGPRLIPVGDARNVMVLAFGSGEWRWGDLLANAPSAPLPIAAR